ncbi:MAG: hypothetical protein D6721_03105 [Gammaproteobacteria bacterium]|nr:MAG: hypothetical protein D6721_03105 [Gammaproteobacteria bacterium]
MTAQIPTMPLVGTAPEAAGAASPSGPASARQETVSDGFSRVLDHQVQAGNRREPAPGKEARTDREEEPAREAAGAHPPSDTEAEGQARDSRALEAPVQSAKAAKDGQEDGKPLPVVMAAPAVPAPADPAMLAPEIGESRAGDAGDGVQGPTVLSGGEVRQAGGLAPGGRLLEGGDAAAQSGVPRLPEASVRRSDGGRHAPDAPVGFPELQAEHEGAEAWLRTAAGLFERQGLGGHPAGHAASERVLAAGGPAMPPSGGGQVASAPVAPSPVLPGQGHASGQAMPVRVDLHPALGQPGWDQGLGEKITWLVGHRLQAAEIHLNPPHLGPVEVRIQLHGDQGTQIHFHAQHAVVREAIEAALPRLRELMHEAGVTLGQVHVADHSQGQAQQGSHHAPRGGQPEAGGLIAEEAGEEASFVRRFAGPAWSGGLDLFV